MWEVAFEKKSPIEKFPSLILSSMLALIIQFSLYYLLSGRLREVKNKRKFKTFSSKSGRGHSLEVVAYKRLQM